MVLIKSRDLIELKQKTMINLKILYTDEFLWSTETTYMQSLSSVMNHIMNVKVYDKLKIISGLFDEE